MLSISICVMRSKFRTTTMTIHPRFRLVCDYSTVQSSQSTSIGIWMYLRTYRGGAKGPTNPVHYLRPGVGKTEQIAVIVDLIISTDRLRKGFAVQGSSWRKLRRKENRTGYYSCWTGTVQGSDDGRVQSAWHSAPICQS